MPSNKFKTRFPPARIKKIMQTDEEVGKVAAAVPVVVSKSLELFTEVFLAKCGEIAAGRGARTLSIDHIKQCVDNEQKFDFLREIVAEAAAKAVGKTPEEATAVAALSLGNSASSTSSTVPKSVNYTARRKNQRVGAPNFGDSEQLKPEPFSPGFPGPSSSVITQRSPVAEKLRLSLGKRQQVKEESDLDSDEEDLSARSVYTTPDKPVFPPAQPREIFSKSPSASPHVLNGHSSSKRPKKETERSSGTPTSVIVRSPPAVASRSNGSSPGLYANTTKVEPLRLLSPMVTIPSPFFFGASPMYSSPLAAFPHSPVDPFAASYQQQLMMAMMMQQQQQLQQAQLPLIAQERNQERESTVSRPTYGSPMDYPSAQPSQQQRSVIVPTSSAQDLRLHRPVDLTSTQQNGSGYSGQRYAMYQEKDGPI